MTTTQTRWADLSHWEWPRAITGPTVLKATEGVKYVDPSFRPWCTQAATAGHNAFAYHVLHRGSSSHMRDQARFAFSVIGRRPAMFDVEVWPAESGSPAGVATVAGIVEAVSTYRHLGGVMHVCYLPRHQWEEMGRPNLKPLILLGLSIINADYRAGAARPGSFAWKPYGGITPWALQYAACHNVANSNWASAKAVWTHGTAVAPQPAPAPGYTNYTARQGDTMWSIALRHGMTLTELEQLNPHAGHPGGNFDLIWPGDVFRVRA